MEFICVVMYKASFGKSIIGTYFLQLDLVVSVTIDETCSTYAKELFHEK